jgi:hypothetical protein
MLARAVPTFRISHARSSNRFLGVCTKKWLAAAYFLSKNHWASTFGQGKAL